MQYIVEHYDDLPSFIIFLHSHRNDRWHTDSFQHSNVESVRNLNTEFVLQNGYVNLRCIDLPGCPAEIQPFRSPADPDRYIEWNYARAYQELFQVRAKDVPQAVGVACCSQFAVSRDQVLRRPLEDYQHYYDWVLDTDLPDDVVSGIMQYTWHIIFGMDPV